LTERKERRAIARVALPGVQIVRTLHGVEAHLIDLSLHGARIAHFGVLRPGSRCFVQILGDVSGSYIPVQVLWCMILGAEWRSDGERHLWCHSGLQFTALTAAHRMILTGVLWQLGTEDPARRERDPASIDSPVDQPRRISCPREAEALLTGTNGRNGNGTHASMIVLSGARPEA